MKLNEDDKKKQVQIYPKKEVVEIIIQNNEKNRSECTLLEANKQKKNQNGEVRFFVIFFSFFRFCCKTFESNNVFLEKTHTVHEGEEEGMCTREYHTHTHITNALWNENELGVVVSNKKISARCVLV